jgi:ATP-binding cassette subfamily C protein
MRLNFRIDAISDLVTLVPTRTMLAMVALMAVTSLTEGLGILALVPVLGGVTGQPVGQQSGVIGQMVAVLGPNPALVTLLLVMIAVTVVRVLLVRAQNLMASRVQQQVVDDLRAATFGGVIRADWRWLAQTRASDHANLIVTNIGQIGYGFQQTLSLFSVAIAASAYLAAAFLLSWPLSLVTMAGGAFVLMAFSGQRRVAQRIGQALGEANRKLHAFVQQGFAGVRIIKAHGLESPQLTAFRASVASVRQQQRQQERAAANGHALLQVGGTVVMAAILYAGIVVWQVGIPTLLPLLLLFARLVPMIGSAQQCLSVIAHSRPAMVETKRLLAETAAVAEVPPDPNRAPLALADALVIDNISVSYAGREQPALANVSLSLRAQTTTALMGASGAGKSTLADILMGLIAPDAGQMLIDGMTIGDADRGHWRRSIAYVQQEPFLFHDSIRFNLTMGQQGISDAVIDEALRRAQADFVFALPQGVDTMVGDGGVRLSGGERQRVALARALIGQPALLILDEATSALDPANEAAVRATMAALRGTVTMLFISHRESMQADADQVIELEAGHLTMRQHYGEAAMIAATAG